MLSMHNNLMKRFQKELKTNTAQVEQIATLSVCIYSDSLTASFNYARQTLVW